MRTHHYVNRHQEEAAWRQAIAGDGDAFGLLFDAHSDRVHRHALRLTRNVHDAEDVLAAAFLELWRRRHDVRVVDGSVLPWLLVAAGNLALNQGRGLRRHRAFLARLPRQEPLADPAEVQALRRADLDVDPHLLDAINRLSRMDQQLLGLVALENYPLRSAAEVLGLTESAARSRWQRIRCRLARTQSPDSFVLAEQ
jgi:RNA polymerase sigma-70 factor (ECF subfamily)